MSLQLENRVRQEQVVMELSSKWGRIPVTCCDVVITQHSQHSISLLESNSIVKYFVPV